MIDGAAWPVQGRPICLFSGKGGVGKTTMAAAAALLSARSGARTLLVSTDPAHSTGDVLGVALGEDPTLVEVGLWAAEIDPDAAAARHVAAVAGAVRESVSPELLPAVQRHLDLARHSPGTLEAALFDRMAELIEACPSRYDRIVFDTAPSGHTLRLLSLPSLLSAWVEGLVRQREKVAGLERMLANLAGETDGPDRDPVLARLHQRRAALRRAGERLRTDAEIWLVLVPERLPIEETARADHVLRTASLSVAGLVVNRVLPADADGSFLADRRAQQIRYLDEIGKRFAGQRVVTVAQQRRDITARDQLLAIAGELASVLNGAEADDPAGHEGSGNGGTRGAC